MRLPDCCRHLPPRKGELHHGLGGGLLGRGTARRVARLGREREPDDNAEPRVPPRAWLLLVYPLQPDLWIVAVLQSGQVLVGPGRVDRPLGRDHARMPGDRIGGHARRSDRPLHLEPCQRFAACHLGERGTHGFQVGFCTAEGDGCARRVRIGGKCVTLRGLANAKAPGEIGGQSLRGGQPPCGDDARVVRQRRLGGQVEQLQS